MKHLRIFSHVTVIVMCAVAAFCLTLPADTNARSPWPYALLGAAAGLISVVLSACLSLVTPFYERSAIAQFLVLLGLGLALQAFWLPEHVQAGIGVAGVLAGTVGLCIDGIARAKSGA